MTAADVTRWFHSRGALLTAAIIAVACAYITYTLGNAAPPPAVRGLLRLPDLPLLLGPLPGMAATATLNIVIAALMCYINKAYNLLRAMTRLQGSLFLLMEAATPALLVYLCPGALMCAVLLLCMLLTMSAYDDRNAQRQVFLTFLLLSAGLSFDFSFGIFIPVFILATAQMRIFSLRTLTAAILGMATPWIIIFGFGIASVDSVQRPSFAFDAPDFDSATLTLIGTAVFTAFVASTAWIQNVMMKFLSYNARSRARLSVLTVITLVTLGAAIADFTSIYNYLPLLNCCAAMQVAHLMGAVYSEPKSYIAILSISLIYIMIFVWQIIAGLFLL